LASLSPVERHSVKHIASRDNLFRCAQEMIRDGGRAPGLDRVRPEDLTPSEIGRIAEVVSEKIMDGSYRPHKTRPVDIPKNDGGLRTLQIRVFWDRVVARALHEAVSPLMETTFLDMSYGFRKKRNAWKLLADLKIAVEDKNKWVLAVEDVRRAFDSVRVDDVIDAHRTLFKQHRDMLGDYTGLLTLIGKVLRGADPNRRVGIDQGCPYSPDALNSALHVNHDVLLVQDATKPFWLRDVTATYRYADNLVYVCQSVKEGHQVLGHVRRLLRIRHLELKGTGGVYDLAAGDTTQLLGFTLRRAITNEMKVEPGFNALDIIRKHLCEAHQEPDPVTSARLALRGWTTWMGPAFKSGRKLLPKIGALATDLGLRESFSKKELHRLWHDSWTRWRESLLTARRKHRREQ
jgi:retron-type reverse transcriptase